MSVITKRGDDGQTDFMFGRRCAKNSLRVQAYGDVDELNAAMGLARALGLSAGMCAIVDEAQAKLVALMGELATLPADLPEYERRGYARLSGDDVARLEQHAHAIEQSVGAEFPGWQRPGQGSSPAAAALHLARAVCRRAERSALALHEQEPVQNQAILLFLNRLSDLLFLITRHETA